MFHVCLLPRYVASKVYMPPPLPIGVDGALEYKGVDARIPEHWT